MSTFQQYNQYPWLTPVRVAATSNQTGTYFNGQTNNGVGATLTYATGSLTIDSVVVVAGDRVLLADQTNTNENGIYMCIVTGATGVSAVLQRAADQQSIEQLLKGQYVTVAAGSVNGGGAFVMVEPLPAILGVSALSWLSQVAVGAVAFSGPASTANALAVFSDTAGNLKAQSTASTLGFGLTLATGNFAASQGTLTSGSSGNVGGLILFPATAANGTFLLTPVNAGGAFNTTISNGVMGQSTVYTVPDIGAATGFLVVNAFQGRMKSVTAAVVAGGAASQVVTDAFCTTVSTVMANWNTSANLVSIQKVTPGNGSFTVLSSGDPGASTLGYIIMKA